MADIGARVYNSGVQGINSGVWTAVTFDSERYDTNGIHDPGVNPSRLTCQTAGTYNITAHIAWPHSLTNNRGVRIRLNGTTIIAGQCINSSGNAEISNDTIYKLAVSNYVEMLVYQSTGVPMNTGVAGNYSPEFAMQLMVVT